MTVPKTGWCTFHHHCLNWVQSLELGNQGIFKPQQFRAPYVQHWASLSPEIHPARLHEKQRHAIQLQSNLNWQKQPTDSTWALPVQGKPWQNTPPSTGWAPAAALEPTQPGLSASLALALLFPHFLRKRNNSSLQQTEQKPRLGASRVVTTSLRHHWNVPPPTVNRQDLDGASSCCSYKSFLFLHKFSHLLSKIIRIRNWNLGFD